MTRRTDTKWNARIGKAVRDARKKAGITGEELARRVGHTRQSISGIERGAGVSLRTLGTIARELDVRVSQLLGE